MDFTKASLPDSVMVSGRYYKIRTGHSFWFRFVQLLGQEKILLTEFDYLYTDAVPEDRKAGVDALSDFCYERKEIPRIEGDAGERVLDYEIDSDLIFAAILQCFRIDLFKKQVHWHKVRAMIAALKGTKLNDVMEYRCTKPGKNKELERLKRVWELPEKISREDQEALDRFNSQFN